MRLILISNLAGYKAMCAAVDHFHSHSDTLWNLIPSDDWLTVNKTLKVEGAKVWAKKLLREEALIKRYDSVVEAEYSDDSPAGDDE